MVIDIKFLLIFYLVQMSSFSNNTLGKQLKDYIYSNRILQHIINIIFIFVLMSLHDYSTNIKGIAFNSIFIYLIYILSTKLDLQFNLIFIGLLVAYYFYLREINIKNNRINDDTDINIQMKHILTSLDDNKINVIGISIGGFLLYAVYLYLTRKIGQYGGGFSYSKFLVY